MFIWVRIKAENHPDIGTLSPEDIAERVFQRCIDNLVLMVPSSYFKAEGGKALTKDEEARRIFFRVCYATPTMEELEEGVRRFAAALKAEFRL
jgi:aromatic amino acid aminotransferase I